MVEPIQRIYANAMQIQGGPYDVALQFGERLADEPDIDYHVRISMSWEHVVAMITALQRVVDDYQAKVGSVRNVEEAIASMEEEATP